MVRDLAALAERQWQDYQASSPGTFFAEQQQALSLEQAYLVQAAVAKLRADSGDRIIGYKVGCTGPGTIRQFDMAGPIRGFLYGSEVHASGATLDSRRYANLAIEGEIALRIGDDGEPMAAFPVIELHHFVFRGARKTLVELVANNGLNAGVVLPAGEWPTADRLLTAASRLDVHINDRLVGTGGLWPLPGGAGASVAWLRDHLRAHNLALTAGDLVLAGTPLGLYPVAPGDHVRVGLDGQAAAECKII